MMSSRLDVLIETIQDFFGNQISDGTALKWDRNRYFDDFKEKFGEFQIINNTDFNYSYCNSFDLKVPKSYVDDNYIITLKLSFITNAYVLFVTWYSDDFRKGKVVEIENIPMLNELYRSVIDFAESKNFEEVRTEWLNVPIKNVQLELAETPTVDKCLFDDF